MPDTVRVPGALAIAAAAGLALVPSPAPPDPAPPAGDQEAPPATDVFLAELTHGDGGLGVGPPRRITDRPGYDNQPSFLPDGRGVLYTSYRGGQADAYLHRIPTGRTEQLTDTPESEYSPTVTPSGDRVSVVRVEADSTQRLWSFPLGGGPLRLFVASVEPVGYHAWMDASSVALYVLGEPATLRIHSLARGSTRVVARDVGRSLHRVPGGGVSYVQWDDGGRGWITRLGPAGAPPTRLAALPGESEFYAWTPEGRLLATRGSVLHEASPVSGEAGDGRWREVADLARLGRRSGLEIGTVSRLAVGPDGTWLAFVASEE